MEDERWDEKGEEDVQCGMHLNRLDEVEEVGPLLVDDCHTMFGCVSASCNWCVERRMDCGGCVCSRTNQRWKRGL